MKKIATVVFICLMMALSSGSAMASAMVSECTTSNLGSGTFDTSDALKSLAKAVFLVVILGAVAIYVTRKVMPKVNAAMGKELRVVESISLGTRKQVHVIKVGTRKLLIGGASESITFLADVTDALKEGGKNE